MAVHVIHPKSGRGRPRQRGRSTGQQQGGEDREGPDHCNEGSEAPNRGLLSVGAAQKGEGRDVRGRAQEQAGKHRSGRQALGPQDAREGRGRGGADVAGDREEADERQVEAGGCERKAELCCDEHSIRAADHADRHPGTNGRAARRGRALRPSSGSVLPTTPEGLQRRTSMPVRAGHHRCRAKRPPHSKAEHRQGQELKRQGKGLDAQLWRRRRKATTRAGGARFCRSPSLTGRTLQAHRQGRPQGTPKRTPKGCSTRASGLGSAVEGLEQRTSADRPTA